MITGTGALLLWAASCLLCALAGAGGRWAQGFYRGARWGRAHHQPLTPPGVPPVLPAPRVSAEQLPEAVR